MIQLSLLPAGEKALVAVSGGRDSVGLLHHLSQASGISELEVVHIHHGLRKESSEEFTFVGELCQSLNIPFHGLMLTQVPHNETEAREARYKAFITTAQNFGCSRVVTAHHREDQLETRLMNLIRGCSPKGLAGMPESRELAPGVLLVRPALNMSREEVGRLAKDWREDKSNQVADNVRNELRLNVIPKLQELAPRDVGVSFQSLVDLLTEDLDCLEALVPPEKIISIEKWRNMPLALQRRWLRKMAPLERDQVQRGLRAAEQAQSVDLGHGVHLKVGDGTLSLRQKKLS